ncbi:MAG: TM2 domain-containing protein [Bacilli bacterium]|nr:TM2 domain-containing protein [Bacilli bacterium]
MPICKKCHSRIDKFNKDRCPICGAENPFDGVSSDTIEITTNINTANVETEFNPKKKSILLALFISLGIFGIPFFYINKIKTGIIYALANISLLVALIVLLIFLSPLDHWVIILVSLLLFIFVNSLTGLYFYNKDNLKDGRGVFLN